MTTPRKPRRQADTDIQERVRELLDALKMYGQHVTGCMTMHRPPAECSCGLERIIKGKA